MTVLDADATAMHAASANVVQSASPSVSYVASDGFTGISPEARFDWIVSNPPVHRGQPDDFSILEDLCRGAVSHLSPGGSLFVVAQEHVPVGLMIEAADSIDRRFARVGMLYADGRFVVWRADIDVTREANVIVQKKKKKQKKN
jgi:16S rRNA (guanine1207-N2)-methyltransferase